MQQIVKKESIKKKSKLQQKYEALLRNVEKEKRKINNLTVGLREIMPRIQAEIKPLQKELDQALKKRIMRLDAVSEELGVGKFNRQWFDSFMAEQVVNLLEAFEFRDEELKTLYQKYSGEKFDDNYVKEQYEDLAKSFKESFGLDLDVEELFEKGPEAYFAEHMNNFMNQLKEKQEENAENQKESKVRNRSKKQAETELKRAEEEKLLAQDAKSIYMRLIKKYHPDLEQDVELKEQKTEIVQRVTKAFQENDFLELLKLQIELLDEGESDASNLAEDMLMRYNKILQKQLNELQFHIYQIKMGSQELLENYFDYNFNFSEKKFIQSKKEIENEIKEIEADLRDSYKKTKGWFKTWMSEIKEHVSFNMFSEIFSKMF